MQLALDFSEPETICPFCEEDLVFGDLPTIYCLDIRFDDREQFAAYQPCCSSMAWEVESYGYEAAMGISVAEACHLIGGYDVLEVFDGPDGGIVARLRVKNPTRAVEGADRNGITKAASPRGWQTEVFADVEAHHSHHEKPNGWKFGVAVYNGHVKVGVMIVAPPVARMLMQAQPRTAEVTRGTILPARAELRKNAATKLYAAVCKQARQLGYDRMVTYTMAHESGHSLLAAGWTVTGRSSGGSWDRDSRARMAKDSKTNITGDKVRWEKGLTKRTRKLVAKAAIK
jgi:hypothetical protein